MQDQKAKKAMMFCRTRWAEHGEKSTGYFFKMQKRDMEGKVISILIETNNGI